ncbi:MAG: serine/threonine-protein kinase [Gemmatimonadaceae bacterium]
MTPDATAAEQVALAEALRPDFEVEREIGRGGMGVVYRGTDVKLDRPVAIKALLPHLSGSAQVRERFLREARTAAKLSHPNIVPIFRADEVDPFVFYVMALVDGDTLGQRIRRQSILAPAEAVPVLVEVARALDYAHLHGVVHRDVKPENILLEPGSQRALVTDFGIARVAEAAPLTATGQVLGTVHFMSPEQVSGELVDGRSDLYSLGVVAYLALTGRLPFDSETASAVLVAHVTTRPPPAASVAPHLPAALASVVDTCLAKDPAARFQRGNDLADALEQALRVAERDPGSTVGVAPQVISEGDAQELWRRAAELQARTGSRTALHEPVLRSEAREAASLTHGYRLDDARAAAVEAGIGERFVERAAQEMGLAPGDSAVSQDTAPHTGGTRLARMFLGAATRIVYEVRVDGEARPDTYDRLVEIIQRGMADAGHASTLGRSLAWSSSQGQRRLYLSIVPRDGATTIRAEESLASIAGGMFGGILGGGGGGIGVPMVAALASNHVLPVVGVAGVAVAIFGTVYGIARTAFTLTARRKQRTLTTVVDRLAAAVRASGSPTRPRSSHPSD